MEKGEESSDILAHKTQGETMSQDVGCEQMHENLRLLQLNKAQMLTEWKMEDPSGFEPSSVLKLRAGLLDRFVRHLLDA